MSMTDDDIYVNAGDSYDTGTQYYDVPAEQKEEEIKEAAIKAASYPILGDVADWFEAQINQCESIENIQFDVTTIQGITVDRKISVEAQVLAYRMLRQLLDDKYQEFKDFRRE